MCVVGGPKIGKTSLIKCLTGSNPVVGADANAMVSQWDTTITDSRSQQRFRIWKLSGAGVHWDTVVTNSVYRSVCAVVLFAVSDHSDCLQYHFRCTFFSP